MDYPVYRYLHSTCCRRRGGGGDRPRVRNETVFVENRSFPEDNRDSGLHHNYPDRHIPAVLAFIQHYIMHNTSV